jgi:hypothetical protein
MTIQASPSDQLIFAPVGIAHLTALCGSGCFMPPLRDWPDR